MKIKEFLYKTITPFFLGKNKPIKKKGKNVLIIRDDALGDLLLFSGVLHDYIARCKREGQELYLLVDKIYKEIAELYLPSKNILIIDKRKYFYDLKYRIDFIKHLRTKYYDVVIGSIHASSVCRDIMKYSYGLRKENRNFSSNNLKEHILNDELDFYTKILKKNITKEQILPFIPKEKLLTTEIKNYFILLGESGDNRRNYTRKKLLNIAKRIIKMYNLKCILLGTDLDGIDENMNDFLDLRGKTSIKQALEIIKCAKLVIGNETGLSHAAWIMQIPTVMIYGGGHFGRFLPLNEYCQLVTYKMECYQCDWKCIYNEKKFPCITNISEQDILNVCEKFLNEVF